MSQFTCVAPFLKKYWDFEIFRYSLPSSVSCQTMPSRLTLVPGWQGPRQAESPSSAPEMPPSWVLVPIERVLTASCLGLEVGRAGGEKEGAEGREDPGAPGWPGAGGAGTVNMGSTWTQKETTMHGNMQFYLSFTFTFFGINPLIAVKLDLMKFRSMSVLNTSPENSRGEGEGRELWTKT